MKISVIIPIYKVEAYLHQCVDSVLKQSYKDLEIILVDDGSPDGCPIICNEYAQKDSRVKVIHKPNGGLSDARNSGITVATGDYVVFLDSDDYYNNPDFFRNIIGELKTEPIDLVCFQRQRFVDGCNDKISLPVPYDDNELNEDNIGCLVQRLSTTARLDASASMKFLNRAFLIENKLYFKKGIYSEDVDWFMRVLLSVKTMKAMNFVAYCYRVRSTSISHNVKLKNIQDLFSSVENYANLYLQHPDVSLRNGVLNYLAYQFFIVIGYTGSVLRGEDRSMMMEQIKKYTWLVKYALNRKTKMCACLYRYFGLDITAYFLGKYMKLKR